MLPEHLSVLRPSRDGFNYGQITNPSYNLLCSY